MTADDDGDQSAGDDGDRMDRAERIRNKREGRSGTRASDERTSEDSQTSQREQTEQSEQTSQTDQPSQSDMSSQPNQTDQSSQTTPVKERPHRTIYLPEEIDDDLETAIDTLQFKSKTEHGRELVKNRHAYPLLVYLGLQRANEMDVEELLAVLEETDALDDPPAP